MMAMDFEEVLDRIINKKSNDSEEEAFREKYIYTENGEDFHYVEEAATKGYTAAYRYLADRYAKGNGCPEDWGSAFHYWNLSVQKQQKGYAMIGDCYRLGKGTDKDYDKAWEAYENANRCGEAREDDGPTVQELLLIDEEHLAIDKKIEIDWLKHALTKRTKEIPPCLYHKIARLYFKLDSEEYISWLKSGVEAGDIGAKCSLIEVTEDAVERENLILELLNVKNFWGNYEAVADLAKSVIDDKNFEKTAFRFLWEAEEDRKWLFDHYQKQKREADLETLLRMVSNESEEWLPNRQEIPEGYFKCPACGHIRSLDESDPDRQGEICNECYRLGNYHR